MFSLLHTFSLRLYNACPRSDLNTDNGSLSHKMFLNKCHNTSDSLRSFSFYIKPRVQSVTFGLLRFQSGFEVKGACSYQNMGSCNLVLSVTQPPCW